MIAWVLKTSADDDGEPSGSVIHAYRKKKPVKGSRAMARTLCEATINWEANLEGSGYAFAPAFPPGENDAVCDVCKKKAT